MRAASLLTLMLIVPFAGCAGETGGAGFGRQAQTLMDRERISVAASSWTMQEFHLSATAAVHYDTESRNDDSYSVCLIDQREEQFWKDGNSVRGYACNGEVTRAADGATLPAGTYFLAFRCHNLIEDCILSVTLTLTG